MGLWSFGEGEEEAKVGGDVKKKQRQYGGWGVRAEGGVDLMEADRWEQQR